jgi:hypothetical protein
MPLRSGNGIVVDALDLKQRIYALRRVSHNHRAAEAAPATITAGPGSGRREHACLAAKIAKNILLFL